MEEEQEGEEEKEELNCYRKMRKFKDFFKGTWNVIPLLL